jgi:GH24 family phage-related lysozyme (muramidase)
MIRLKSLLLEQDSVTKKLNVLFIGDSQTVAPYSYARQLISNGVVEGEISAKGGISMRAILDRFKLKYSPGKYDAISIMGGNNDAGSSRFDNDSYKTIINMAQKDNTPVIIVTAPTMKFIDTKMYPSKYPSQDAIPAWQKTLEADNVKILDAYSLLDSANDFVGDGLHLTKNSHTLLMKAWVSIVSKINPNEVDINKVSTDVKKTGELKFGDVGDDVKTMQENLIALNYSVGPELNDGIFGPHTKAGVLAFQKVNMLKEDGIAKTDMLDLIKSNSAKRCPDNIRKELDQSIISSSPKMPEITANFRDDAATQAFPLIAKFEQFRATSYPDVDGYQRIGYGSSTITFKDNTVVKLGRKKSAYVITQEDATRDLERRIKDEFLPMAVKTITKWGQDPNKFNAATLAILTSICYNYGSIDNKSTRPTLRPAIEAGDAVALANTIAELRANKKRRRQEAEYILASLGDAKQDNDISKLAKKTDPLIPNKDISLKKSIESKPDDDLDPDADLGHNNDNEPGLFSKAINAVKNTLGLGVNPVNLAAATVGASVLSTSAVGSNTYGIPGAQPGGEGGDWGGSMGRVLAFAKVAKDTMGKNYAGSQKRGLKLTASGNVSDHYLNNPIAYAVDMGVRSLEEGDQLLANLMAWFGRPDYKGNKWFNVTKDGYRYQVGWRVSDHYDHVHVGVKKIGKSADIPVDQLNKTQQDILAANPKTPAGE